MSLVNEEPDKGHCELNVGIDMVYGQGKNATTTLMREFNAFNGRKMLFIIIIVCTSTNKFASDKRIVCKYMRDKE